MPGWAKTLALVIAIIAGGVYVWWQMNAGQSELRLDGHRYTLEIRDSEPGLTEGLSNTASLPTDHAMLFVFGKDSKWQMWMKDMNYPIDMVWLNDNRQVVYTVKNAEPSSYNKADPSKSQLFTPDQATRYVIELPSGTIEKTGIKVGDPAGLPSGV